MVKAIALVAVLAAGCVEDSYRCAQDSDCDLGDAGRCELDHRCTAFDVTCASGRRYAAHAGSESGTCFDDRAAPRDVCSGGQPPAVHADCAALVCDALPACCEVGWVDACAEQAELRCAVTCDTRIAITAVKGGHSELWDLRWDGVAWSATQRTDLRAALSWLAPAPGTSAPRLGGIAGARFVVDDGTEVPLTGRAYQDVSSVDLDRDGRDTIALSSNDPTSTADATIEIVKLDDGSTRTIPTDGSLHPSWGDYDHDAFLDAVTGAGARYVLAAGADGPGHVRTLVTTVAGTITGGATPGSPQLRAVEWNDLDGDGALDLIASGSSIRVHLATELITNLPTTTIDCSPPSTMLGMCTTGDTAFTAVARPAAGGGTLVLASFPTRALYRATVPPGPPATVDIAPLPLQACPGCAPFIALVARDLDGDHQLDLIAIDADLHVSTQLTTRTSKVAEAFVIPTTTRGFVSVAVSVTGATP